MISWTSRIGCAVQSTNGGGWVTNCSDRRERDVAKTLDSVHRMKGAIELALTVDSAVSILEIQKNTRYLKDRLLNFNRHTVQLSEQQELQVMLEWLDQPDPSFKHNEVRKKARGTRLWFLESNAFEEWRDSEK